MFSKTGNPVDSAVNQALHQGVGTNPLAGNQAGGQGLVHQGEQYLANQALHNQGGVNPLTGGAHQGVGGQGIVHQGEQYLANQALHHQGGVNPLHSGVNQGMGGQGIVHQGEQYLANQALHHQGGVNPLQGGMGAGMMQQGMSHMMGQSGAPMMAQDQTLGHNTLGTVQGMVGQGVSAGLGYHTQTPLPVHGLDPQVNNTGLGHRQAGTTHHTGTALGAGALGAGAVGAGVAGAHGAHGKALKHSIVFRPIEARFNHDKDLLGKMDPYCKFKIGLHRGKSLAAKGQGVSPVWNDSVVVKHKAQEFAKLKIKDKDRLRHDDTIGTAKIPLDQVIATGAVDQWIPVEKAGKVTGEIHLIIEYVDRATAAQINKTTV